MKQLGGDVFDKW